MIVQGDIKKSQDPARALLGGGPRVVVSTAAFHARDRGSVPGLGGFKETKLFLPHPRVKVSIVGSLRDREVACSASDRQGSNFDSCVWRTVSSQSSHHPQEVLLAQFSLNVHKGGLKPDSFHFIFIFSRIALVELLEYLLVVSTYHSYHTKVRITQSLDTNIYETSVQFTQDLTLGFTLLFANVNIICTPAVPLQCNTNIMHYTDCSHL